MTLRTRTRLTAIGSGKGGTGKTVLAIGLANALSAEGERVLLFDADMGLANTSVQLGLDDGGDLDGVIRTSRIGENDIKLVSGGTRVRGGFDLLAPPPGSGAFANSDVGIAVRLAPLLRTTGRYDRVILDLAAGVDEITMMFSASADETLLVMTPDPAALTDAYAFVKLALRAGGAVPGSIVNMAAGDTEARRVADSLVRTCRSFLDCTPSSIGYVPRDARVAECIRRQDQLLSLFPQSPAARAITGLAQGLHRTLSPRLAIGTAAR